MSTYVEPEQGVEVELVNRFVGNTFDPPKGSDWWECPFCDNAGSYDGLRSHMQKEHNLRVVESTITIRVNRVYDDEGQVVRYVEPTPASDEPESEVDDLTFLARVVFSGHLPGNRAEFDRLARIAGMEKTGTNSYVRRTA